MLASIIVTSRNRDQVRALVLGSKKTCIAEVAGVCPFLKIRRGEDANDEFLGPGHNHDPFVAIARDLRVTEIFAVGVDDRVAFVPFKGVAAVERVSDFLRLQSQVLVVDCEDGDYTVSLIGEETRSVVGIGDRRSRENS